MEYFKLKEENEVDLTNFQYPNQKIGVIIEIQDKSGKILLQQRGPKARDEQGLFEDVGGQIEESDKDFYAAIKREMTEEMGTDVMIENLKIEGLAHFKKREINWLFVIFTGIYKSGKIKVMEQDKCLGYRFFTTEEALNSDIVTKECQFLIKKLQEIGE